MDTNVLLSKIVATPKESGWSQAYSTLNLYIVLSIKSDQSDQPTTSGETGKIVAEGKELFERIQREYFSLDEKNLKKIKESVDAALDGIEDKSRISVLLATLTDNILYIVIATGGSVILKREDKLGVIAKGTPGITEAFSGELKNNDIVLIETEDFANKLPIAKLTEVLDHLEVSEISESLAPLIHEDSLGSEAAIVLQYKNLSEKEEMAAGPGEVIDTDESGETEQPHTSGESVFDEPVEEEIKHEKAESHMPSIKAPKINAPSFKAGGKKKLIIAAIIILVVILLGSIVFERSRMDAKKRASVLNEILGPAQKKYDEASDLISLNKGLALDDFNELKADLDRDQAKLKTGTPERQKLDEFIGKVESKIGELGTGNTVTGDKVIFDNVSLVYFNGSKIVATDKDGKGYVLDTDGTKQEDLSTDNKNTVAITASDTDVFIMGDDGITRSPIAGGTSKTAVKDAADTISMGTFGTNLYGLNSKDKTVYKYAGGTTKGDYFTGDVTLNNPTSMAIDSSIWIMDDGKIKRFTRGKEDSFIVNGLTGDISPDSQIFTGVDYANVYVLDKKAAKIISINKSGEVQNQYMWTKLSGATSFAVNEDGKKIYITIDNKLYSIDL
ncbi:MAG TPA: hypothetical protein VG917_04615 [Patescibacteria group bacterium]|nr:hypothetical protein [Patescibacteria group bacterium]